jgi:hypothetical protein
MGGMNLSPPFYPQNESRKKTLGLPKREKQNFWRCENDCYIRQSRQGRASPSWDASHTRAHFKILDERIFFKYF